MFVAKLEGLVKRNHFRSRSPRSPYRVTPESTNKGIGNRLRRRPKTQGPRGKGRGSGCLTTGFAGGHLGPYLYSLQVALTETKYSIPQNPGSLFGKWKNNTHSMKL